MHTAHSDQDVMFCTSTTDHVHFIILCCLHNWINAYKCPSNVLCLFVRFVRVSLSVCLSVCLVREVVGSRPGQSLHSSLHTTLLYSTQLRAGTDISLFLPHALLYVWKEIIFEVWEITWWFFSWQIQGMRWLYYVKSPGCSLRCVIEWRGTRVQGAGRFLV